MIPGCKASTPASNITAFDLAEGLYYGLEQSGAILGVPEESAIRHAVREPPATPALIRGCCIQKFAHFVEAAQWGPHHLASGGESIKDILMDLFAPEEISSAMVGLVDGGESAGRFAKY